MVGTRPGGEHRRQMSKQQKILLWTSLSICVAAIVSFVPPGYDYSHYFGLHVVESSAMPWTDGLLYVLPWPILVALTVVSQVVAVDQRGGPPWIALLAIFSLPTIWTILIGQLEGLAVLGIVLMPWSFPVLLLERRIPERFRRGVFLTGVVVTLIAVLIVGLYQGRDYYSSGVGGEVIQTAYRTTPLIGAAFGLLLIWGVPLVLIKPHLSVFALLSRKSWLLSGLLFIIVSIVAWGLWMPNLLLRLSPTLRANQPQDIALFPWSLFIAVPMLWYGRGDKDMLMAAGSYLVPTLHPYHFTLLMPALARLPVGLCILCWLSSFLPLTANYLGPQFWLTGNFFPLLLWLCLWRQQRRTRLRSLP